MTLLHKFADYEEYKRIQIETNVRKLKRVWIDESSIEFISDKLKARFGGMVESGVCHGTRRGKEQEWFRKYLLADVFGTEISHTATEFPNTIEWDFHKVKEEWLESFDFVYSNSLDHSYDPEKALRAWMSCLKPNGCLVLHWEKGHRGGGSSTSSGPFGATLGEYVDMFYRLQINLDEIKRMPVATQGWAVILTKDNPNYGY